MEQKVAILTCESEKTLSNVRYGFFTREGGVSKAPYDSLNVGLGSDDLAENIIENRRRAMQAFIGKDEKLLCTLYQIHSDQVVVVNEPFSKNERPEGDAMVTNKSGIVLGVLTADCGPILFADDDAKVIGAAHAGWRGAIGGVLENTIAEMEKLGAKKNNIQAFIGPCIHQNSYEVNDVFYDEFVKKDQSYREFFITSPEKENHYQFNLPDFIKHRLQMAGIKTIRQLALDTYLEKESFFSFRRNTHESIKGYGRGLSVITLR